MTAKLAAAEVSATALVDQVESIVAGLTARNAELELQLARVRDVSSLITQQARHHRALCNSCKVVDGDCCAVMTTEDDRGSRSGESLPRVAECRGQ